MGAGACDVMACFHPLQAYQVSSGEVIFTERGDVVRSLSLPCGQCVGCRLERSRQWAMRCMHEASLHKSNSFITLTYSEDHLPDRGSLHYADFQRFMKRLRKKFAPLRPRFYMCGEYGENFNRPHFHACIFGLDFPDRVLWRKCDSGSRIYRSAVLEALWPFGYCSIGDVTFESAAYVARYCMKKVTGKASDDHYRQVDHDTGEVYNLVSEFNHMSLKPGIGANWLKKFQTDVYPHDYVVINGKKVRPPKYYDKRFAKILPDEWEDIQFKRESDARLRFEDNTPERLAVREVVTNAALSAFHRNL